MVYGYTHFIPQNTAPNGAKSIGVYNSKEQKVYTIQLGRLTPTTEEKQYSFGLLSDLHVTGNSYTNTADATTVGTRTDDGNGLGILPSGTKLRRAMEFFSSRNVDFCCHTGDMTNVGFYWERGDTEIYWTQFKEYRDICALFPNMPMYGVCGNHDSYNKDITENLSELEEYTGNGLYYTIPQGNDLFIFIGQPAGTKPMSDEALQWCYETLEANRNKRCFIFVHPHISNDSGNPLGVYTTNPIFDWWGNKTNAFKNLLRHYKNTILFHGHTHFGFVCQEFDSTALYTERNGFRSVHVPSLSYPRSIVDGAMYTENYQSYGYIVDVYNGFIILNGWDFINNRYHPL